MGVCYDSSLVGMLLTYKNGDVDESGLHCELKGISTNITVQFRTVLTHTFVVQPFGYKRADSGIRVGSGELI